MRTLRTAEAGSRDGRGVLVKPAPTFTQDDVWTLLERELAPASNTRPANSVTAEEYAIKYGVTISYGNAALKKMVKRGLMERVRFRPEGCNAGAYAYYPVK